MNSKKLILVNLKLMNRFFLILLFFSFLGCSQNETKIGIEVCAHFNNADATIIQCSDQYYNQTATYNINRQYSAEVAEFEALKSNIPIHVFEEKVERGLKEFVGMGRGGVSMYYPSCSKEYRKTALDSIIKELEGVYGRKPTTIAYGCGKTNYSEDLPNYILGGRNSSYGSPKMLNKNIPVCTYYGEGFGESSIYDVSSSSFIRNRLNSSRSWANVIVDNLSELESLDFIEKEVERAVSNNGFYVDFMHWHIGDVKGKNAQKFIPKLFNTINKAVKGNYISKVDYNQAIEYQYAKSSIDSVSLVEKKDYYLIKVYTNQRYKKIDYSVIKTPVSFKTLINIEELMNLGGDDIESVSKVNGAIIINALINFNEKVNVIKVNKKVESKFLSLTCDAIYEDNKIYSEYPIKVTFFKKNKNDFKVEIIKRSLEFKTVHTFDLDVYSNEYDYYAGIINKLGESKIIKIE